MGTETPYSNARNLQSQLVGLSQDEQQAVALKWAEENGRIIDMFGEFAKERHLLVFKSGNEFENWIDPLLNVVYKMNNLMHVGGDIHKLLERISNYNELFPETALRLIGFHKMSSNNIYPVFVQSFISNARFATTDEIERFMGWMDFKPMLREGYFENDRFILSDIKPKNVLCTDNGTMFVIDAEIQSK